MEKTIKISQKAHKKLSKIKIETGNATFSDTIEILTEWWNWWINQAMQEKNMKEK